MNMEYKLIMAVSGFPSLYDTNSLTYRDLNIRSDAWRQVAELVGVPESECRRKWKTLRDQHRRERQREKERRESGIGLLNYRPWRYSSILSFLNPFIDARAAGTNGWALDRQHAHLHAAAELVGCSTTTTDTRSSDDESYGFAVADATTTSSEFGHRKRSSSALMDAVRFKEAKIEESSEDGAPADGGAHPLQHTNMKQLLETVLHSVTTITSSLASSRASLHPSLPPSWHPSMPKTERQEEAELLMPSDEDDEEEEAAAAEAVAAEGERCPVSPRPPTRRGVEALLEGFLRRTEAREAQREREAEQKDDVTLFLLSLAPAMRRLLPEKQSWVRTKMQQFLHEAEFGAIHF